MFAHMADKALESLTLASLLSMFEESELSNLSSRQKPLTFITEDITARYSLSPTSLPGT